MAKKATKTKKRERKTSLQMVPVHLERVQDLIQRKVIDRMESWADRDSESAQTLKSAIEQAKTAKNALGEAVNAAEEIIRSGWKPTVMAANKKLEVGDSVSILKKYIKRYQKVYSKEVLSSLVVSQASEESRDPYVVRSDDVTFLVPRSHLQHNTF